MRTPKMQTRGSASSVPMTKQQILKTRTRQSKYSVCGRPQVGTRGAVRHIHLAGEKCRRKGVCAKRRLAFPPFFSTFLLSFSLSRSLVLSLSVCLSSSLCLYVFYTLSLFLSLYLFFSLLFYISLSVSLSISFFPPVSYLLFFNPFFFHPSLPPSLPLLRFP